MLRCLESPHAVCDARQNLQTHPPARSQLWLSYQRLRGSARRLKRALASTAARAFQARRRASSFACDPQVPGPDSGPKSARAQRSGASADCAAPRGAQLRQCSLFQPEHPPRPLGRGASKALAPREVRRCTRARLGHGRPAQRARASSARALRAGSSDSEAYELARSARGRRRGATRAQTQALPTARPGLGPVKTKRRPLGGSSSRP